MSVREGDAYPSSTALGLSPTLDVEATDPGSRTPRGRHSASGQQGGTPWRPAGITVLSAILVIGMLGQSYFSGLFTSPAVQTWATIFTAICVQAVPFLVMGVVISSSIAAFVPASFFARALPKRQGAAVPVAGWPVCCYRAASAGRCRWQVG